MGPLIRETAGRLGIELRDIHHAPGNKVDTIRDLDRPLVDDDDAILAAVREALGANYAIPLQQEKAAAGTPTKGCLMLLLNDEVSERIRKFKEEELSGPDVLEDEPESHVTVLYGFDNSVGARDVLSCLETGPMKVGLGVIKRFPANEKRPDSDVLVLTAYGWKTGDGDGNDELTDLNAALAKEFGVKSDYNYNPHVTLAYVKPGTFKELEEKGGAAGKAPFDDQSWSCHEMIYTKGVEGQPDRDKTKIRLVSGGEDGDHHVRTYCTTCDRLTTCKCSAKKHTIELSNSCWNCEREAEKKAFEWPWSKASPPAPTPALHVPLAERVSAPGIPQTTQSVEPFFPEGKAPYPATQIKLPTGTTVKNPWVGPSNLGAHMPLVSGIWPQEKTTAIVPSQINNQYLTHIPGGADAFVAEQRKNFEELENTQQALGISSPGLIDFNKRDSPTAILPNIRNAPPELQAVEDQFPGPAFLNYEGNSGIIHAGKGELGKPMLPPPATARMLTYNGYSPTGPTPVIGAAEIGHELTHSYLAPADPSAVQEHEAQMITGGPKFYQAGLGQEYTQGATSGLNGMRDITGRKINTPAEVHQLFDEVRGDPNILNHLNPENARIYRTYLEMLKVDPEGAKKLREAVARDSPFLVQNSGEQSKVATSKHDRWERLCERRGQCPVCRTVELDAYRAADSAGPHPAYGGCKCEQEKAAKLMNRKPRVVTHYADHCPHCDHQFTEKGYPRPNQVEGETDAEFRRRIDDEDYDDLCPNCKGIVDPVPKTEEELSAFSWPGLADDIRDRQKRRQARIDARDGEKQAAAARPTAVIVKGNPRWTEGAHKDVSRQFYDAMTALLQDQGYGVSEDPGEPFTQPVDANLWVGHSRGIDRLRFAPATTRTVSVDDYQVPFDFDPNDPDWNPPDSHYALTPELAQALGATAKQAAAGTPMYDFPTTGPEAIQHLLKNLSLEDLEAEAKGDIASRKKTRRPRAVKILNLVEGLRRNNLTPEDMMISKVPVIQPTFRPFNVVGDTFMPGDANELYKDLIDHKDAYTKVRNTMGEDAAKMEFSALQQAVRAVHGFAPSPNPKTLARGVSGFLQKITGPTGPKTSYVHRRLLSKTQDSVGRGVIIPDPDLTMDEVGIPADPAWRMYGDYVQRNLVRSGMSSIDALKHTKGRSSIAHRALLTEFSRRPVIYSRSPAWHQFNIISGRPKLVDGDAIRISPFVTAGLGADFDGDTANLHVPADDDSIKDAYDKLMPSKMVWSIKDPDKVVPVPKHEMVLQVFKSSVTPASARHRFATQADALKAIQDGKVQLEDDIDIGPETGNPIQNQPAA